MFARRIKNLVIHNMWEFFQNTSIHGLKYVGSSDLHMLQRIFFAVAFTGAFIFASFFITKTYEKWVKDPIIVGINPKPTFIINEPFPAVTICNMNQVVKSRLQNIANDSAEFAKVQFLCNLPEDIPDPQETHNEKDLIGFLVNISQPCSDMVIYCRFGGIEQNCSEFFNLIVTSQGVCCVFNMLHPKFMYISRIPLTLQNFKSGNLTPVNWSAETGYQKNLTNNYFPLTTRGTGESVGFTVILNVESNNYYCSAAYSKGFKILMHSPNETPNVQETGLLLSPGRQTKIRIRPEKTQTHKNLRNHNWRKRYCLFQDEYTLQYFAHYTQRNCEMECVAHVMLKHCGCISFYLPLFTGDTPICGVDKFPCVDRVRMHTDASIEYCLHSCLPSCNDFIFYADASVSMLASVDPEILSKNFSDAYLEQNIAVVNIYFKEFFFRSSVQKEFIGTAEVMANIGGIMGLFLGISFISILEVFFYIFLRPIQNLFVKKIKTKTKRIFVVPVKSPQLHARHLYFKRNQLKHHLLLDYARYSLRRTSFMNIPRNNKLYSQTSGEALQQNDAEMK